MQIGKSRHIWMVTPEIPPLRTTGGLADAVHGLSHALVQAGHRISVFVPAHTGALERAVYEIARKGAVALVTPLPELKIDTGSVMHTARTLSVDIPINKGEGTAALTFYFIDNTDNNQFGNRINTYGDSDDACRYLFFNRVIAELFKVTFFPQYSILGKPDVIHCHDWGTGYIGYYLRHFMTNLPKIPLIYNIHNLGYSEQFDPTKFMTMTGEINPWVTSHHGLEFRGKINPHKAAILFFDRVITVSNTYKEEILSGQTPEPANRFAGVLQHYSEKLRGVTNGIPDHYGVDHFHTSRILPESYSPEDLSGKRNSRRRLQQLAGLSPDDTSLILSATGRWAEQKGTDIMIDVLTELMPTHNLQFVTLGSEAPRETHFADRFSALKDLFPNRVACLQFTDMIKPPTFTRRFFEL